MEILDQVGSIDLTENLLESTITLKGLRSSSPSFRTERTHEGPTDYVHES